MQVSHFQQGSISTLLYTFNSRAEEPNGDKVLIAVPPTSELYTSQPTTYAQRINVLYRDLPEHVKACDVTFYMPQLEVIGERGEKRGILSGAYQQLPVLLQIATDKIAELDRHLCKPIQAKWEKIRVDLQPNAKRRIPLFLRTAYAHIPFLPAIDDQPDGSEAYPVRFTGIEDQGPVIEAVSRHMAANSKVTCLFYDTTCYINPLNMAEILKTEEHAHEMHFLPNFRKKKHLS